MFDFLFKRSTKKSSSQPAITPSPDISFQEKTQTAAQIALLRAGTLGSDEAEAVEFILQCKFADARLQAAEHVHSQLMLERVLQHVRNTDRRVAKMVQARLDTLQRQEYAKNEAQHCVELAQRLTQDAHLLPNQLVDLDRRWQVIEMQPEGLRQQFDASRESLRIRLEAQTTLQRSAIDLVTHFKNLIGKITPESFAQFGEMVASLSEEMARIQSDPEALSLPKSLCVEFEQLKGEFERQRVTMAQQLLAITMRQVFLEKWEASEIASRKRHLLQSEWHALPVLKECDALCALQARFDALMQSATVDRKTSTTIIQDTHELKRIFAEALDAMEKALEDGLLQMALENDKAIRSMDASAWRPSEEQDARLAKVRAEMSHLQGWARWGGNVSREELLKAAEELPLQSLTVIELAKKVGSLRERWKSLGASAGRVNKELWQRFDAACTRAYEPAAAHFKMLAEERQQNLMKARALIASVQQFLVASNCTNENVASVDLKSVAHFSVEMKQKWQRLGTIDRKEKKQLEAEFLNALAPLMSTLENQRALEVQRREKLIQEAAGLNPKERGVVDAVRDVQERWQLRSKSLPLERDVEQLLWVRFKKACDHIFEQRKMDVAAADTDRHQHLQKKEEICSGLEATIAASQDELNKILREARVAWGQTGQVPRVAEAAIEARFQAAVLVLQQLSDAFEKSAQDEMRKSLRDKFRLCHALENAIVQQQTFDLDGCNQRRSEWQAIPTSIGAFEAGLSQRFEAALAAVEAGAETYAAILKNNRADLSDALLCCEIVSGIDSPPAQSQDRLRLQIEVLQSAFKNTHKAVTLDTQLQRICGLPAYADHETMGRIERLIDQAVIKAK